jgi:hypothetical protein
MAVTYTTLFTRLGRLFDFAKTVRAHQGQLQSEYEDTASDYSATTSAIELLSTMVSRIERRIDEAGNIVEDLQETASAILTEMMDDDTTLGNFTRTLAIQELIRQMRDSSQTVDRPASGYVTLPASNKATAAAGNSGDGIMLLSDMAPLGELTTSEVLDFPSIRSETIKAYCSSDSSSTRVQEGAETFVVEGQRAVSRLSEDWPVGSGTRGLISAVNPKVNAGRKPGLNVCTNSDFEDFTSDAPDRWTIQTGTAGTHISAGGSGYTGSESLLFTGDGATAPHITQTLRNATESDGVINPDKAYTICCAVKYATAAPSATLLISVRDSGGTILHDSIVGRAMQLSISSASLTTSWQLFSAVVFSPVQIDKGAYVDIRFTGNQANTSQVYVDDLTIAQMYRIQPGGLAYQIIPGSTPFKLRDEFTASILNNCTTGDGELALEFDRFFDMASMGLVLPSSTSPTLADATYIS